MKNDDIIKVKQALLRRAVGYETEETTEEYVEQDGEIKLVRRKVSTKSVPPDVTAVKMVMEEAGASVADMTDEELKAEKQRLLSALKEDL
ncbi:MAG: hypothetical protein J6U35_02230 [Clostridia bacterium]|nr:hypothetical protein [Clostridia bacterium]